MPARSSESRPVLVLPSGLPVKRIRGSLRLLLTAQTIFFSHYRYIGVSEYNVEQLEKVNKIAHIDALQIELSAWTPDVLTNGVLAWCEKSEFSFSASLALHLLLSVPSSALILLSSHTSCSCVLTTDGTALVAYSPLGRGILTGQFSKSSQFEEGDFRHGNPRFEGENFKKNLRLVEDVQKVRFHLAHPPAVPLYPAAVLTASPTIRLSFLFRRSPPRKAARRAKSRSPGCSLNPTSSSRSRAPRRKNT